MMSTSSEIEGSSLLATTAPRVTSTEPELIQGHQCNIPKAEAPTSRRRKASTLMVSIFGNTNSERVLIRKVGEAVASSAGSGEDG